MQISIIIPTFNEEQNIGVLVSYLLKNAPRGECEVIVADGGSTDETVRVASEAGAMLVHAAKARSIQMNLGATVAHGDIIYFVHADCLPPESFYNDIINAVASGYTLGRYRSRYDTSRLLLKLNAWFTRFDFFICMGGDQTLFITKQLFDSCKGFDPGMQIMEEYEFCRRARVNGRYKIFRKNALISARKYEGLSWLRVQIANARIVRMFRKNFSQQYMLYKYQHMLLKGNKSAP